MALVAIQCKNCGGSLQVEAGAKSYYCPNCRTSYAMEQTINQTIQNTNIGHIERATIIDDGSGKIDQEIYSGEAFLQLRKFNEARDTFQMLTGKYAHKYRAWWGLARAWTENFTRDPQGQSEFFYVSDALESALQLAPADDKPEIQSAIMAYCVPWQKYYEQLTAERSKRFEDIEKRANAAVAPIQKKIDGLRETISKKEDAIDRMETLKDVVPVIGLAVMAVLFFFIFKADNGLIGSILLAGIASGLIIFLPLKLIFVLIYKGVQVPAELLIGHSRDRIAHLEADIEVHKESFGKEIDAVRSDTAWLDY